jgi:hypothetical protein
VIILMFDICVRSQNFVSVKLRRVTGQWTRTVDMITVLRLPLHGADNDS